MTNVPEEEARLLLLAAFTAGWQAGLAVTITNPRVHAIVESCFEMWLREAADEVDVLGLPFRRYDLPVTPRSDDRTAPGRQRAVDKGRHSARSTPRIPTQRRPSEDAVRDVTTRRP